MDEEVREVEQHRYEYKPQSNIQKAKSINKLQGLMHDATLHIKMNFHDVLEDIDYK